MKSLQKQLLSLIVAAEIAVLFSPIGALAADSPACTGAKAVGGVCGKGGFESALGNILNTVFYLVGALAVIAILVGAVRYVSSTGDSKRVEQAKNTIVYAITGLIVAILAQQIVGFIIGSIF